MTRINNEKSMSKINSHYKLIIYKLIINYRHDDPAAAAVEEPTKDTHTHIRWLKVTLNGAVIRR